MPVHAIMMSKKVHLLNDSSPSVCMFAEWSVDTGEEAEVKNECEDVVG
jgi:hypothetical protein